MSSRLHITGVLVAVAMAGCSADKSAQENDAGAQSEKSSDTTTSANHVALTAAQIQNAKVKWALPMIAAIPATTEVPAQIVANEDRTARVSAPAEARAVAVHVSPGQLVSTGTRLVTLQSQDASTARSEVSKAQAEVASRQAAGVYSRTARERAERLLSLKAIPRQDYERAIADDELAKAGLAQARSELIRARSAAQQLGVDPVSGAMTLRSPISGVVVSREVVPGAVVMPGTPLVTITDPSSLWLEIAVPQGLSANVATGSTVRFTVAAAPTDTFTARVQSVGGAYDANTRSLPVRAVIANPGNRLRPETFAKAWISGGTAESYPTVPDAAIQRIGGKPVVLVATPDTKGGATFEAREVEIRSVGNRWAVIRGLKSSELVVIDGAFAVKSQIEKAKMPEMEM
ncbi:MAG TPA: efflux RND transporter periplasmic adaptor subunit [Gemmatimonadaceae bacterium]|nr:efflux RND transporter periplasmic adaptor subunit [Gemmatimonadaceae bacterium]